MNRRGPSPGIVVRPSYRTASGKALGRLSLLTAAALFLGLHIAGCGEDVTGPQTTGFAQLIGEWGEEAPPVNPDPLSLVIDGDAAFLLVPDVVREYDLQGNLRQTWDLGWSARDLALGPAGQFFFVGWGRVEGYDRDRSLLASWDPGYQYPGDPLFGSLYRIDLDPAGNVYILDPYHGDVDKFTAGGELLRSWTTENGVWLRDLAVLDEDVVIVTDGTNGILASTPDSPALYLVDTDLQSAHSVTRAHDGGFIVAESWGEVHRFAREGEQIDVWGLDEKGDSYLNSPSAICEDEAGNVYVGDQTLRRVIKFNTAGDPIAEWEDPQPPGALSGRVNLFATGKLVYTVDRDLGRVQTFDRSGSLLSVWGRRGSVQGRLHHPEGLVVDSAGNIFVLDAGNSRITRYDAAGNVRGSWVSYSQWIALGPSDLIHDLWANTIRKYRPDGTLVDEWRIELDVQAHDLPHELFYVSGMTVDALGRVYLSDRPNRSVHVLGPDGEHLNSFAIQELGAYGPGSTGAGLLDPAFSPAPPPINLAVDSHGRVAVDLWGSIDFYTASGWHQGSLASRPGDNLFFDDRDDLWLAGSTIRHYRLRFWGNRP